MYDSSLSLSTLDPNTSRVQKHKVPEETSVPVAKVDSQKVLPVGKAWHSLGQQRQGTCPFLLPLVEAFFTLVSSKDSFFSLLFSCVLPSCLLSSLLYLSLHFSHSHLCLCKLISSLLFSSPSFLLPSLDDTRTKGTRMAHGQGLFIFLPHHLAGA